MNSSYETTRKRPSDASMRAGWMAIALVAAIGVIWILPAIRLGAWGQGAPAMIAAALLPLAIRSRRWLPLPVHVW